MASAGTVNALFRIGDHLTGRFPLQLLEVAAARRWLEEEADAARELAGRTAYATPEPVAIGEPGPGYPLPWSVQTWVPGTPAAEDDPGGSVAFAHDLADFIAGVRSIDTRGRTFAGPVGAATSAPTTPGWTSASRTASTCSTCPGSGGSGPTCATCRGSVPT